MGERAPERDYADLIGSDCRDGEGGSWMAGLVLGPFGLIRSWM